MKRIVLSLAALLVCGALFAQEDSKNAVVSVENDYNPTIVNVKKKNFTPTVEGKSNEKPAELIFSKQATPYMGFTSEKSTKEVLPAQEDALPGYLRAGYGIRNEIDAKVAYNLNFGDKSFLRFSGALDGFKCNVTGDYGKWNSRIYNSAAGVDFGYKFKKLVFDINGNFNNRVLNYQRTPYPGGLSSRQHHMNYDIQINGVSQLAGPFAYTFNAGYTNSMMSYTGGVINPIREHHINAGGTLAYEIYTKFMRRIGIDMDFNGFLYNNTLQSNTNSFRNYFSMDLNPFADFNFNNWLITFGANLNIHTDNGPVFAIAPHVTIDKALTKRISFYGKFTGGRKDNSFKTIESITPYWGYTNRQIKPTYRIIDALAGTRMTLEPLYFDIFAGYVLSKDDLLQTAVYSGELTNLIYTNFEQGVTNDLFAGCRIGYDYGGWINVEADARYDHWACKNRDFLLLRPEVTANAKVEVRPIRNLTIKLGYNFTHYSKGEAGLRVSDKHDLYLRANYTINRYIGAFIQGSNLLNDKYYEYAGYYAKGISGMLGATLNF